MRSVERVIRASVMPGTRLQTRTARGVFEVSTLASNAIVRLLGEKRARTRIPFAVLDAVVESLRGRGWVLVCAVHATDSAVGTVEAIIKPAISRSAGNYVAALLQNAGLVEVALNPMRVRLRPPL